MPPPDVLELPALLEPLESELTDCLKHPEAFVALPDEAFLD